MNNDKFQVPEMNQTNLLCFNIFDIFSHKAILLSFHLFQTVTNSHVMRVIHTAITNNFEFHNDLSAHGPYCVVVRVITVFLQQITNYNWLQPATIATT